MNANILSGIPEKAQDFRFILQSLRDQLEGVGCTRAIRLIDLMLVGKEFHVSQVLHLLLKIDPMLEEDILAGRNAIYQEVLSYHETFIRGIKVSSVQQVLIRTWVLVFSHAQTKTLVTEDLNIVATSIHRTLHHLTLLQRWHYEIYYPLPNGFWGALHSCYQMIDDFDLNAYALIDVDGEQQLTLEQIYLRILVFETVNPSGLAFGELEQVYDFLSHVVKRIHLGAGVNRADLYAIDLNSDLPPIYRTLASKDFNTSKGWRTFDPADLVEALKQKYLTGVDGRNICIDTEYLDPELVERLIRIWSSKPVRKYHRHSHSGVVKVEVTMPLMQDDFDNVEQNWEMVNTSPTGYCLMKASDFPNDINVGDIIRVQEQNLPSHEWSIAVIRWLRHSHDDVLLMGVELLSPKASVVDIIAKEEKLKALLLPNVQSIGLEASLILPSFACESGDVVQVSDPMQNLKLGHRIHCSEKLAVFKFSTM